MILVPWSGWSRLAIESTDHDSLGWLSFVGLIRQICEPNVDQTPDFLSVAIGRSFSGIFRKGWNPEKRAKRCKMVSHALTRTCITPHIGEDGSLYKHHSEQLSESLSVSVNC
jgi:hypothetical protein